MLHCVLHVWEALMNNARTASESAKGDYCSSHLCVKDNQYVNCLYLMNNYIITMLLICACMLLCVTV